ncbi:hypothetical protein DFH07DRAFT_1058700 [Mycena maculata]|uniref:Uncharacterized protein n=1 Tax=Mycena maculata TaxID=230809 RepID=A0AAD7JKC5_9AGAR|nr:hypothetical protein DFH07DRAFT_1058700 [Mycena maculata]
MAMQSESRVVDVDMQAIASRALAGSPADLGEIQRALVNGLLPLTREALELFLAHLKTPSNGKNSRLRLVETAFRDLTLVLITRENLFNPDTSIISAISNSWPAICSSLVELYGHHKDLAIKVSRPPAGQKHQVMDVPSVILTFIETISHWPDISTTLQVPCQLQQVTTIFASIWTGELTRGATRLDFSASETLASFISCREGDARLGTSFIERFDSKPVLTKLLLGHLETSCKSQASYLGSDALLIGFLIEVDPDLKGYLLSQSSTRKFIAALKWFVGQTPSPEIVNSLAVCLKCLVEATDGVTWVKQVLRANILPALSSFYHYKAVENKAIILLSQTLSRYLVYKSVLRETRYSLDDMI